MLVPTLAVRLFKIEEAFHENESPGLEDRVTKAGKTVSEDEI